MILNDVYSTIRNLNTGKLVYATKEHSQYYGLGEYDLISYEYDPDGKSSINIVCPRDPENNFMYVEIDHEGILFTKIYKGGTHSEVLDLSEEDKFFQEDTVINLGFSLGDYKTLHKDFLKYYNGFLRELTIHL